MTLLLVRHGRTEANATGRLLGRLDVDLDAHGRAQAAALGSAVAGLVGDGARVISSPLARTRQTADALGLPVTVDERWIELDYGGWDGRPLADVAADDWRRWRADPHFTPPGGESLAALGTRVREACDALAADAAERDVVVVTHVSPLKAAVAWALGVDDEVVWRMFVSPASITRVRTSPTAPSLLGFNETLHLPEAPPSGWGAADTQSRPRD